MLGLGKPKQVAEHQAEGEIERVYHEIRQVLRVSGVNLNFRTWAGYEKFLPAMWDAIRPNPAAMAVFAHDLRVHLIGVEAAHRRIGEVFHQAGLEH